MALPEPKAHAGAHVAEFFGGAVYVNQDTATADTARRFEVRTKKLRDVLIKVSTYDQYFGDADNQTFLVPAGTTFGFNKLDVSTMYFKNVLAGENGVVDILGVLE